MLDAAERGATDEQALTIGILSGAFEMLFEKYELDSLLNADSTILKKITNQMLSEAVGESATEISNMVADYLVMGKNSNYEKSIQHYLSENPTWSYEQAEKQAFIASALQVAEAGIGGALSGGLMGGGMSIVQNVTQRANRNNGLTDAERTQLKNAAPQIIVEALKLNPDNVQAKKLMAELRNGKSLSIGDLQTLQLLKKESAAVKAKTQKNTAEIGEKSSQRVGINRQTFANGDTVNQYASVNQADVAKSLRNERVYSKDVDGIADAIVTQLNDQELTRTQKYILSSALDSPTVQSVISELMKKKADGIDSALKNAYDEINTIGGNENGRETALWNLQNQRADGSLPGSQDQTRAAIGDRSGVPGTLGENDRTFHETLPAARRGLTSDLVSFNEDDYATVTEGSALHQVQNAFRKEYGIECYVIKDSSWTRSSPAYSRDGVVYIREGIDLGTLSTAVPHETTHVMKQQNFQPYVDFILHTPDRLNFQSEVIQKLLDRVAEHKKIDPFDASPQQLISFYDELNAVVYGLYKSGVLDNNAFDYHEYIPGAFNDFASYIQAMDQLHEEFRNRRNASGQTKAVDGGVDALMKLANEVTGVSSAQMQSTLTSQTDKVSQNPTARNVGQLYATVQAANTQASASINQTSAVGDWVNTVVTQTNAVATQEAVAESLKGKGIPSQKIDTLAGAIVSRVNGQELTRTQRDVLRFELGRPSVQKVINDLIQMKSNGVDSAQRSVYDDSNIRDRLSNEEKAALWNLANQSTDAFRKYDYITETENSALYHPQNILSDDAFDGDADVSDNVITDGSHLENGKLKPNVTYKTGEHDYFYSTNGDGLIVNARTENLQFKKHGRRHKHNPNTYGKEPGDHAGHLFGDRFGGSPELDNLVSQAENVNKREYRKIEEQWAKALKNGQKVTVNINIHYDGGGVRPSSFDVSYTIDGKRYNRKISNQSGGPK